MRACQVTGISKAALAYAAQPARYGLRAPNRIASAAAAPAISHSNPGSGTLIGAAATAIVTLLAPELPALSVTVNCNSKLPAAIVLITTVAAVALPEMLASAAPLVMAHW